jgi:hypothetical protein
MVIGTNFELLHQYFDKNKSIDQKVFLSQYLIILILGVKITLVTRALKRKKNLKIKLSAFETRKICNRYKMRKFEIKSYFSCPDG